MAFFRRQGNEQARAEGPTGLQIPEELALKGDAAFEQGNFSAAAEEFANAIDKLDTMYVDGSCTYRQPSTADVLIFEGLTQSIDAAREASQPVPDGMIERSINQLHSILGLPQCQPVAELYRSAIHDLQARS